jgi:hypothetical protein
MRRVIISALALALLPAAAFAQEPPVQQPPTQPPAQTAPAAPEQPAAPRISFTSPAGMLLVPIKPDQTTAFEEMAAKLKSSLAASTDEKLKAAGAAFKFYKAAEPAAAGNALYVVLVDPAVANTEYDFFMLINSTLTPDEQRDPVNVEAFKRWAAAFGAPPNRLNLTPVGGGN